MFFVIYLADNIFISVQSGHLGILWSRFGGGTITQKLDGSPKYYKEGLNVIFPWNKMYIYDVRTQEISNNLDVLSKDGLTINIDLSTRFFIDKNKLPELHQEIGPDYIKKIIQPEIISGIRRIIGSYRAEEIYAKEEESLLQEMRDMISHRIDIYESYSLRSSDFKNPMLILRHLANSKSPFCTFVSSQFSKELAIKLKKYSLLNSGLVLDVTKDNIALNDLVQNINSMVLNYKLHSWDFKDPLLFIMKIKKKTDPISTYIHETIISANLKERLNQLPETILPVTVKIVLADVIKELNNFIEVFPIYNQEKFSQIELQPESKRALDQKPFPDLVFRVDRDLIGVTEFIQSFQNAETNLHEAVNQLKKAVERYKLTRLNRLLMEDVYKEELIKFTEISFPTIKDLQDDLEMLTREINQILQTQDFYRYLTDNSKIVSEVRFDEVNEDTKSFLKLTKSKFSNHLACTNRIVLDHLLSPYIEQRKECYTIFVDILIKRLSLPVKIKNAIEEKLTEEQKLLAYKYIKDAEQEEKERRIIESEGIKKFEEISGISILKWKGIEATLKLSNSPNSKVVIIGTNSKELPIILNTESSSQNQNSSK